MFGESVFDSTLIDIQAALPALLQTDPAVLAIRETLIRQLQAQKAVFKISYKGSMPDEWLTADMATMLQQAGLKSILDFAVRVETVKTPGYWTGGDSADTYIDEAITAVSHYYNRATGAPIEIWGYDGAGAWAKTTAGDGSTIYTVQFVNVGLANPFPVFSSHFKSTNTFSELKGLLPFVGIALAMFGVPLLIGEFLLGPEIALANPALAGTIGRVAVSTVLSGGDIESAVSGALAGSVGGYVGDIAGTGLDSVEIGRATAALTTAAISGQPIGVALAQSLVSGALNEGKPMGLSDWSYTDEQSTIADAIVIDNSWADIGGVMTLPDNFGNLYDATGAMAGLSSNEYVDSIYMDEFGNTRGPDNQILISADRAAQIINTSPDDATAKANLAQELKTTVDEKAGTVSASAPAPPSRPAALPPAAANTKTPTLLDNSKTIDALIKVGGSIFTNVMRISNGQPVLQSGPTSTYGTPRVQQVGVPVVQPDGSVIVNNGNGTQTVTSATGAQRTVSTSYQAQSSFGGIPTNYLLIGGAALAALLLLRR
jgi:hypothetical protein